MELNLDQKYYNQLDIDAFSQMMKSPSYCYKFYWLEAIVNLISENVVETTFNEIINEMIANAWYSVLEFHVHLSGTIEGEIRDGLERAVLLLQQESKLPGNASKLEIKNAIKEHEDSLKSAKEQLTNMVPYRALAGFFDKYDERADWDSIRRLVAYIERINQAEPLPYTLGTSPKLKKEVYFNTEWIKMIQDNTVSILGWIQYEKVRWLQNNNPEVPGLIYKLAPMDEKIRKLKKAHDLWDAIIAIRPVCDVFTGDTIKADAYEIDHFIPWSFVMNDELWNLSVASSVSYRPQFVSNNHREGKKVLASIEDELLKCDYFQISVAFITMSGITPLLQTLKELETKHIPGEILTTNYLTFSEPKALAKLNELTNITVKMYDVESAGEGFHTKGYIFHKKEIYRIIIGSSNITSAALTSNREWNTKVISTEHGEMAQEILAEFNDLWNSCYALPFDDFYENYKLRFEIINHQREIAKQDEITALEKYKLQPNSMQIGFITNLKKIIASGENRALLISATGTGKTYASAFAMRELGFKRVLFLVHRGQLARQTKQSYERVFANSVTMGLVGAGYHEYDADFIFATVQTLNRDEHLRKYGKDDFDCIVIDEAHHVPADTYKRILEKFTPKLWLGMTATPDKRDDNIAGRNVYEIFNYQIAYEIRLQQAMEENLLCPFHYFGITDLSIVGDNLTNPDFSMLTSDERVKHIITQANYYGYSGDKVKGLIFCSSIKETEELCV